MTIHEQHMAAAIRAGRLAIPVCDPNPPVGCVLVRDGKIVAQGHTNSPGQPHAEAMALSLLPGDLSIFDLYVTLEPCSFHGRTPSCALKIIERGVRSVFVGIVDPDPRNSGAGIRLLRDAGVIVEVGILAFEITDELRIHLAKFAQ